MNTEADIFDEIRELVQNPRAGFAQVEQMKVLREALTNAFHVAGKCASYSNIQTINGMYAQLAKLEREIMGT